MAYMTIRMTSPKTHNGHTMFRLLTLVYFLSYQKSMVARKKVNLSRIPKLLELIEQAVSSHYGTLILDRH
jgi:hypothetical protein